MALTTGPNLGLLVNGNAGEEHYALLMAQWRGFDVLVQCTVIDRDLDAPPGGPATGDAYLVGPAGSGAWTGQSLKIARWSGSAWEFFAPRTGWKVYVQDELITLTCISGVWYQRESPMLGFVNNQAGTTYTFAAADGLGRVTRFTSATAVTATVAPGSLPVNSIITMRQADLGQVTLSPGAGVTINIPTGFVAKTARKGSVLMLHQVASNEWDLTGDLSVT